MAATTTRPQRDGAQRPPGLRRTGWAVAVVLDAVVLWLVHHLLVWGWPGFLTDDFRDVLPAITVSLVVSMLVHTAFVLRDRGAVRHLGDLVYNAASLYATVRLWQVFPVDFTDSAVDWTPLARGVLAVSAIAAVFAIVLHLGRLVLAIGGLDHAGDAEPVGWVDTAEVADRFLAAGRIAVTGVSRSPADHGANVVYRRLRERGLDVVAINPATDTVEGDPCWPDLASVPGGVDAVVLGTRPSIAEQTMRECVALGVPLVWMHRSIGQGSVSDDAAAYGRSHGITVIDGGCPLMFAPCDDPGHRVMRHVCTWAGTAPRAVPVSRTPSAA